MMLLLEAIGLRCCLQVEDDGVAGLAANCIGLQSLSLHCCRRLSDASALALAAHSTHLSNLNISGCRMLSPAAVQVDCWGKFSLPPLPPTVSHRPHQDLHIQSVWQTGMPS